MTLGHFQFLEHLNKLISAQTVLQDNRGGPLTFSTWAQFMLTGNSRHYFNIFFKTNIIIVYPIFLCCAIWIPNRRYHFWTVHFIFCNSDHRRIQRPLIYAPNACKFDRFWCLANHFKPTVEVIWVAIWGWRDGGGGLFPCSEIHSPTGQLIMLTPGKLRSVNKN